MPGSCHARMLALLLLRLGPSAHAGHTSSSPSAADGVLNVKTDFGAKGDATCGPGPTSAPVCVGTDDYSAIQAAVAEAYASQRPLLIPSGTYLVNSPIIMSLATAAATLGSVPQVSASRSFTGDDARREPRSTKRRSRLGEENVYGPQRIFGEGLHQSVIVVGSHFPKCSAIISLPNTSSHIQFSHFTVAGGKHADIGIDAPQTFERSHFDSIGVNGTRVAGIRTSGWINTFENCMIRANEGIGLFLSSWPTPGSLCKSSQPAILSLTASILPPTHQQGTIKSMSSTAIWSGTALASWWRMVTRSVSQATTSRAAQGPLFSLQASGV